MQFEVIKKNRKKSIIIGISIFVILGVVLLARFTFAKYSLVKSIKIAEGTINYKVPDFKIMAMYKQKEGSTCTEDDCYEEMAENEIMPESGYFINKDKTYCTLDNVNKDSNAKIYTDDNGNHVISNLSKYDKCYLYFDKTAKTIILENAAVNNETPDFSKTAQETCEGINRCETTNGLYKAQDDDGDTYYFRGGVSNNYVKFGGFYWRIIRINGDGSIRLIYDGTEAHANGTTTSDSIAVSVVKWAHKDAYWNSSVDNAYSNDNAYAGFKYTLGEAHGLGTKSNALIELEKWYEANLLSYKDKIDINAGFCGDRTAYTCSDDTCTDATLGGGTGKTYTYYGAYIRLVTNKSPILTCSNKEDLYTTSNSKKGNKSLIYPIGLISADEVSVAGGTVNGGNGNYYLYNGQEYWTLSPRQFMYTSAYMYYMDARGGNNINHMYSGPGLRPVINLRSDTTFTFTGTGEKGAMTNPYIVS